MGRGLLHESGCFCYGGDIEWVVNSDTQPGASATTRTLTINYRDRNGGTVSAGRMGIGIGVSGEVGGPGSSKVRVPARVVTIRVSEA